MVLWIAFLLLLPLSIAMPGIGFSESVPSGLVRTGLVNITGKTDRAIIVSERHFLVTQKTTILDIYGKQIDLSHLPIPCQADVKYVLRMDQDPVSIKIVVKEIFPNSSTVFIPTK
jgi:hypothetical protein